MRRREFFGVLGCMAALPLAARAQQARTLPTVGFLGTSTATGWNPWTTAFVKRFSELGWIEGRTVAIEYRWAEGRGERFTELATDLARLKVNIIVTAGLGAIAAMKATSSIPIVFALSNNPVGSGLVASLARPGGNVTGLSVQGTDIVGKRLELLREVASRVRRLAILANAGFHDAAEEMDEVKVTAKALDLDIVPLEIRRSDDIERAFEGLESRADAVYVCGDPLTMAHRVRISSLALGARLPTIYNYRELVEAGGLMSYGANVPDLFRRAADFADRILRGARPGDIPVEQPIRFDLSINLTTAKLLGLTIPEPFLLRANEVIE